MIKKIETLDEIIERRVVSRLAEEQRRYIAEQAWWAKILSVEDDEEAVTTPQGQWGG